MTKPTSLPRLLSIDTLAELFDLSKRTIYRLVIRGLVPRPIKIGRSSRWHEDEVLAALERLRKERGQ